VPNVVVQRDYVYNISWLLHNNGWTE